jgi:homoserine dehydrogenase
MNKKDIDVLVEMTPTNKETGEPGMTYVKRALEKRNTRHNFQQGANNAGIQKLNMLAARHSVQLGIGCTSGGALPTVNGGLIDMAGSAILSIEGVLNGTTNYILEQMEQEGITYHEALKKAMEIGIAEADPTLDVEGWDTASSF